MLFGGLFMPPQATTPTTVAATSNEAIAESFAPNAVDGQSVAVGGTNEAGKLLGDAIDWLSYASIGLAVLAIVLVGIYIITNVASNNSGAAAGNLRRVVWVLAGLIVIFNAPQIVSLVLR